MKLPPSRDLGTLIKTLHQRVNLEYFYIIIYKQKENLTITYIDIVMIQNGKRYKTIRWQKGCEHRPDIPDIVCNSKFSPDKWDT